MKGLSSSVIRRILEDVWCILPSRLSEAGIDGSVTVLFLDSGLGSAGTPLTLRDRAAACSSCDVGERAVVAREAPADTNCLDRLPDDVAERRLGVELVPSEARLAKALDVFSRASDARDLLLLLCVRLVELE